MDDQTILDELNDVMRDLFGNDELTVAPSTTAQDVPGWDSLKHLSLIVAVEERFGIRMTTSELDKLASVGDMLAIVKAKSSTRKV